MDARKNPMQASQENPPQRKLPGKPHDVLHQAFQHTAHHNGHHAD